MVGPMTRIKWLLYLGVCLASATSLAEDAVLPDPTRPPEALVHLTSDGAAAVSGPVLQSVVLRRQGGAVAVISGVMVPLGGKLGDSVLVKIKENEVVLKGPLGSEVLRMTPDVNKKTVVEVPKPAGRRNQRGNS